MDYIANPNRYADGVMNYRQCGNSGIKLPEITLGFWWNYGDGNDYNAVSYTHLTLPTICGL